MISTTGKGKLPEIWKKGFDNDVVLPSIVGKCGDRKTVNGTSKNCDERFYQILNKNLF